jgi:glyceraldehyde 3-phosphate dehydrogenase
VKKLGINGFGRIGKLTLSYFLKNRYFEEIVVSPAPEDTTVDPGGNIDLEGYNSFSSPGQARKSAIKTANVLKIKDGANNTDIILDIDNITVRLLRASDNPVEIGWRRYNVKTVIETTGKYLDPTADYKDRNGSLAGHIEAGAEKVVLADQFYFSPKDLLLKRSSRYNWVTMVVGINESDYDARYHKYISAACPTTTLVAHMLNPLLIFTSLGNLLTLAVTKIHPSEKPYSSRQNNSLVGLSNSCGAPDFPKFAQIDIADCFTKIFPNHHNTGLMVESIGTPIPNGSLIVLIANFHGHFSEESPTTKYINDTYRMAAAEDTRKYLSCDDRLIGDNDFYKPDRPIISILTELTHTRKAQFSIDLSYEIGNNANQRPNSSTKHTTIPVIQAAIYGWADFETWSYIRTLVDNAIFVHESISH